MATSDGTGQVSFGEFIRAYDQQIAPAVAGVLGRSLAQGRLAGLLAAATPELRRKTPWKQGIRAYYPSAARLHSLNVKDNWSIQFERLGARTTTMQFVIGSIYNTHPGAGMLFYGSEQKWTIEPRYPSPYFGGKTPTRLRLAGGESPYASIVMREGQRRNDAFRQKVIGIIASYTKAAAADVLPQVRAALSAQGINFRSPVVLGRLYYSPTPAPLPPVIPLP